MRVQEGGSEETEWSRRGQGVMISLAMTRGPVGRWERARGDEAEGQIRRATGLGLSKDPVEWTSGRDIEKD